MSMGTASTSQAGPASGTNRWAILVYGIICMILISNYQYGWTFFVHPMAAAHKWSIAAIQVSFAIFIALETWLTPIHGWIVDNLGPKHGPKIVVAIGGLFVAAGWALNSTATSLTTLYVGGALSGIGAGAIYATLVGNAVKWFPDHRGLAVGLIAGGYGAGAALTVIPIRAMIASQGYGATFLAFGLGQGILVFLLAWLIRGPLPGEVPASAVPKVLQSTRSYTPQEMLATPVFWLLYIMFILVSASGLMAVAQLAPIARSYNIANVVLIFGASTLTLAGIIDGVANGTARPFFGWVSDRIGRENTMAIAFAIGGVAYWLLGGLGTNPWFFVLFAALIFFTWGEIFSLFPSTCTDSFGPKFATVNLCLLYTAKGASAFLVPLANVLKNATGSWHAVFVVTAIANFVVVALALFVLKPMRQHQRSAEPLGRTAAAE